jgi:hypothetical protein
MSDRIVLATGTNADFVERIIPYLESLEMHAEGLEPYVVCVDCDINWRTGRRFERVLARHLGSEDAYGHPGNWCLQHGAFLKAIPGNKDDVILFTDGDVVLQRFPSIEELEWLRDWDDGLVGVSYNAGPDDTLRTESCRLSPVRASADALDQLLKEHGELQVWNTGVIVARRRTYEDLREKYLALWPELGRLFQHYARQQWLISLILGTDRIRPSVLPYTIHLHGCYELPKGARLEESGVATFKSKAVLFKHNVTSQT